MADIDLIPSAYRHALRMRGWVKNFVFIYLGLVLSIAMTKMGMSQRVNAQQAETEKLQAGKTRVLQQQAVLDELHAKKMAVEKRLELLAGLRGGATAVQMVQTIDRALDNDVWFQEWTFQRAGQLVEHKPETVHTGYFIVVPKDGTQQQDKAWRVDTHMAIKGQALTHSALSKFIQRLDEQPEIEKVRLLKTGLRRYTSMEIIDFEMAVVVDSRPEPH